MSSQEDASPVILTKNDQNHLTLMILGHEQSGKEVFLQRLLKPDNFSPLTGSYKKISHRGKDYTLEFFFNTGYENSFFGFDEELRKSQGIILLFNVLNRESFEHCYIFRDKLFQDSFVSAPTFLIPLDLQSPPQALPSPPIRPSISPSISHQADSPHTHTHHAGTIRERDKDIQTQLQIQQQTLKTTLLAESEQFSESIGCPLLPIDLNALQNHWNRLLFQIVDQVVTSLDPSAKNDRNILKELDIVVVGDPFVGKSSLVRKLINGTFSPVYTHTTEAVAFKHTLSVDGHLVPLKLWDTPGFHTGWSMPKDMVLNAHGFIFVYDTASKQSFSELKVFYKQIRALKSKSLKSDQNKPICILVANKRNPNPIITNPTVTAGTNANTPTNKDNKLPTPAPTVVSESSINISKLDIAPVENRQVSIQEGESMCLSMNMVNGRLGNKPLLFELDISTSVLPSLSMSFSAAAVANAVSFGDISSPFVALIQKIIDRRTSQSEEKTVYGPMSVEMKGFLGKEGRKKGKSSKKYFWIKNGELSYAKDPTSSPKMTVGITQGFVEKGESDGKTGYWFSLFLPDKRLNLTASSSEERDQWIQVLKTNFIIYEESNVILDTILMTFLWEFSGRKGSLPPMNNGQLNNLASSTGGYLSNSSGSFSSFASNSGFSGSPNLSASSERILTKSQTNFFGDKKKDEPIPEEKEKELEKKKKKTNILYEEQEI
eukprot:TRINITY_DN3298_c0_g1_i1.p1 TRINITY_DN3298_c0_g1~~TRINITY_DN3298_c0_g1_i1.p1  ORF type:complete len:737 (+),score=175.15 TRINITY_DN3298_c0_g1_i1:66-2213(+)